MSIPISFHASAEDEMNEAASFYDLESPGLGIAILDDLQKAVAQISLFPEAAQVSAIASEKKRC